MAPSLEPLLTVRKLRSWTHAAIFQGDRLVRLLDFQTSYGPDVSRWTEDQRRAMNAACALPDGSLVEVYEAFFFVVAVRMVRKWLPNAVKAASSLSDAAREFEAATPFAVDLRDMLEHEDAYLSGSGWKQDEYLVASSPSINSSAHTIVIRGDDYLLGDRVSVPKTLEALRRLRPDVEAAYANISKK